MTGSSNALSETLKTFTRSVITTRPLAAMLMTRFTMTRRQPLDHRDPVMTDHPPGGDDVLVELAKGTRGIDRCNARLVRDGERCPYDCSLNDLEGL